MIEALHGVKQWNWMIRQVSSTWLQCISVSNLKLPQSFHKCWLQWRCAPFQMESSRIFDHFIYFFLNGTDHSVQFCIVSAEWFNANNILVKQLMMLLSMYAIGAFRCESIEFYYVLKMHTFWLTVLPIQRFA